MGVDPKAVLESLDAMKARIAALDSVEQRTAALEAFRAQIAEQVRKQSLSLPGSEDVVSKYSMGRASRAMLTGDWKDAGLEKEISEQTFKRLPSAVQQRVLASMGTESRIMNTYTPSAGGYLIPMEMAAGLIPNLVAKAVCKQAGATVVRPSGWPFKVLKKTGATTPAYAAEGAAGSASDISFGTVELNPRKLTARSIITKEQVMFGTPQTDQIIADDIGEQMALMQDLWALSGTGASGQPLGITNTSGINTTAANTSGKLRFVDLNVALQKIEADNVMADKPVLVCHSDLKWELFRDFTIHVSSGTEATQEVSYLNGLPIMTPTKFKELTGFEILISNQLATTIAIVGGPAFKQLWMAEFGGLIMSTSDVASDGTNHAFTQDLVHVKGTMWVDSAVVQAEAFHVTTSA